MSLYLYRQFFWAKITPFLKYILAEYHFWYSNARFRTVVRENRGFGAAVGLPSTPGRKLLRMQSVGLPPWRGRRRPEKAKCLAFSAECLMRLPHQGHIRRLMRGHDRWFPARGNHP
jgi:hypothetical protein